MQLSQFEIRHNTGDAIVKITPRSLMVANSQNSFVSLTSAIAQSTPNAQQKYSFVTDFK